jgi:hypothetical protein
VAGVIHSRLVLSPSGSGFSPPYEIPYCGLILPRISADLGRSELRREADLPQVARPSEGLPPVIRRGWTARAPGTDEPFAPVENGRGPISPPWSSL